MANVILYVRVPNWRIRTAFFAVSAIRWSGVYMLITEKGCDRMARYMGKWIARGVKVVEK